MVNAIPVEASGGGDAHPCDRGTLIRAARLIQSRIDGVSPLQQLLSVPAHWCIDESGRFAVPNPLPRLQTRRRRGIAPAYPHVERFDGMCAGTLVVFPAGFVLEPTDRRHPCLNIARSSVLSATFYRDAFDVTLSTGRHAVVRTDAVDHVDSIFQACFWNAVT